MLALGECLAATDRLESIVDDLLRLTREPVRAELLRFDELVAQMRTHWHGPLADEGRRLVLPTIVDEPRIHASTTTIGHALDVLIDNARLHGTGTVTLGYERITGGVALSVTDEGSGPTGSADGGGDPAGSGHGIGLPLAETLIEAEQGRLLQPRPGGSSRYALVLTAAHRRGDQ